MALTTLSACDSLPRGAAIQAEVVSSADVKANDFAVYPVTKSMLPVVAAWPRVGDIPSSGWISRARGPAGQVIAAGDRLSLTIWENSENSLLATPGQREVAMKEMAVSPDGTIFVPYLDRIYVSGMSQEVARETIQKQLSVINPAAQVQLAIASGRRNSVDLVGGVASPGTYPLPDQDYTVMNLISQGGGVPSAMRNPQVRLVRNSKNYVTSLATLYENPGMDTTLRGGDKLIVEPDKRYFLALGASGSEQNTYFEKDRVTALDAMAMIGGVNDQRGDPAAILVLRHYPSDAVKPNDAGPSNERVVFTLDLTKADGLFSAGEFQINPGDLVMVTESPVNSFQTAFRLVGQGLGVIGSF